MLERIKWFIEDNIVPIASGIFGGLLAYVLSKMI